MAHFSIEDFLDDKVTNGTDGKGKTKPTKHSGDNGGDSRKSDDGGTGADAKQEDTKAKPDGSSDVQTETVAKSGNKRGRRKSSTSSAKSSK